MTVGTSAEQLQATRAAPEAALEYYGICMFGAAGVIREFTGKLSLFK
jgi:hypothetical protein